MLNVGQLNEGVVLDHIEAGKSMSIYHYLKLDQLDCCVAIIKNARSNKMGKKDRRQEKAAPSKTDRQCDQMQESSLHHIDRARTGSGLCPFQ